MSARLMRANTPSSSAIPAGCLTSSVATLKVLLPPVMTTQPQSCAPAGRLEGGVQHRSQWNAALELSLAI